MLNKKILNLKNITLIKIFLIHILLLKIICTIIYFLVYLPIMTFFLFDLYYLNLIDFCYMLCASKKAHFFFINTPTAVYVDSIHVGLSDIGSIKTYTYTSFLTTEFLLNCFSNNSLIIEYF